MKKVWLINPYGTLRKEGWGAYRTVLIAEAMSNNNYQTTLWISNVIHRTKQIRRKENLNEEKYAIRLVPSILYSNHISLQRIRYEKIFERNLYEMMLREKEKPELIIISDPALFFSKKVLKFCGDNNVKLVVDIIDLWPEMFNLILPSIIRRCGNFLFNHLYKRRNNLLETADGVIGITADYLHLATKGLNIPRKQLAYYGIDLERFEINKANTVPEEVINFLGSSRATFIHSGTIGEAYDISFLCETIPTICSLNKDVKFLFVGDGPLKDKLVELSRILPGNVLYLGSVDSDQLPSIYMMFNYGLCSYAKGSTVSMPTKVFDYLAAGLSIVHCLGGDIKNLCEQRDIGYYYEPGHRESFVTCVSRCIEYVPTINELKVRSKNTSILYDHKSIYSDVVKFVDYVIDYNPKLV